jgi:hypothetical protein
VKVLLCTVLKLMSTTYSLAVVAVEPSFEGMVKVMYMVEFREFVSMLVTVYDKSIGYTMLVFEV